VAANGQNVFQLIAIDEVGYWFLNGNFIATLDLSSPR
jgi:hypothetical protein